MEPEAQPAPSGRPRTSLLVLLGIAIVAFAMTTMRDSADPEPQTSNPGRPRQQATVSPRVGAGDLDLQLERLKETPPAPDDTDRNPFRFQPKAPPPPPPPPPGGRENKPVIPQPGEGGPPATNEPPPIPLKFIGVTEAPGVGRIAALSDCRHTVQGKEGESIDGRYKIVKIGIESLVIEYMDGRGRTTLPMNGQACVTK